MSLRFSDLGREISKSDDPSALLNDGVLDLNRSFDEAREGINHQGQRDELSVFYEDAKASELPVLAEMVEAREMELYRQDFTEEVSEMVTAGDWAGVLDRYDRGFDDGMLDRNRDQGPMEAAAREAMTIDASRQVNIMRDTEGWDAAITWLNSTEVRKDYPYMQDADFRSLQQNVRSQREVDDRRMRDQNANEWGSVEMWAMGLADKGEVASLAEIQDTDQRTRPRPFRSATRRSWSNAFTRCSRASRTPPASTAPCGERQCRRWTPARSRPARRSESGLTRARPG